MKKYIIGITGASGGIYAKRLIEALLDIDCTIHIVPTDNGRSVFEYENSLSIEDWLHRLSSPKLMLEDNHNLFSTIASGSQYFDAMVVVPCSMGTLAQICYGMSQNLLARAADVTLKEKRKLILVPREAPLSAIHLENLYKLSTLGAVILPPSPGFYMKPETFDELVNFTVGKILDALGIENNYYQKWGYKE